MATGRQVQIDGRKHNNADDHDVAMRVWRDVYSSVLDRLDSIRQGLERHSFYISELEAIDEALDAIDTMAWHPKEP